jgi:hypothetical protein
MSTDLWNFTQLVLTELAELGWFMWRQTITAIKGSFSDLETHPLEQ